mmetsp:Transcript_17153/g.12264  ORF Transcript_17153/g.12264 Transcript_17153/m.12264 type:complete len:232 (+) Transcript_17153:457-1152(+)
MYSDAQKFVNYLLEVEETEPSFKEKLFARKELSQYLSAKGLEQFKPNRRCLSVTQYSSLSLKVGFPFVQEMAAGAEFYQMVVVEEPNSVIFCGFSTLLYDIQFGFYRVVPESELNPEDDNQHLGLEEIYALTKIESYPNPVKVSFIAKEPGIYKILWSNNHSWFKAKTLRYKISVMKPVIEERKGGEVKVQEEMKEELMFPSKISTSKKIALQKLLEIPPTVFQTYSNINS